MKKQDVRPTFTRRLARIATEGVTELNVYNNLPRTGRCR